MFYLSLVLLFVATLIAWVGRRKESFLKYIQTLFNVSILLSFALGVWASYAQYHFWKGNDLSKLLLPPYQDNYFLFYAFTRIFAPYVISLLVAGILILALNKTNKRRGKILLEEQEIYLAAMSIFLVGHPGWILYFPSLMAIYLLWHIGNKLRGVNTRLPLYYLWTGVAILTIIYIQWGVETSPLWLLLKI